MMGAAAQADRDDVANSSPAEHQNSFSLPVAVNCWHI